MLFVLAQDAPPPEAAGPGLLGLLPFVLMFAVMWLVVIRPQKKQEKERKARVDALKKGDKVRTRGGIVAPVLRLKDEEVILGIGGDRSVEVTVHKGYIEEVYAPGGKSDAVAK